MTFSHRSKIGVCACYMLRESIKCVIREYKSSNLFEQQRTRQTTIKRNAAVHGSQGQNVQHRDGRPLLPERGAPVVVASVTTGGHPVPAAQPATSTTDFEIECPSPILTGKLSKVSKSTTLRCDHGLSRRQTRSIANQHPLSRDPLWVHPRAFIDNAQVLRIPSFMYVNMR
jgi:hypothetical protein